MEKGIDSVESFALINVLSLMINNRNYNNNHHHHHHQRLVHSLVTYHLTVNVSSLAVKVRLSTIGAS